MNLLQFFIIVAGMMAVMMLGYYAFAGKSPAKESQRRLTAVRYRHSQDATTRLESQLKKAIAARKPRTRHIAGSENRIEALRYRLIRSGQKWTVAQYFYASLGTGVVVALLMLLQSGALLLSLIIGLAAGAGIPHLLLNMLIGRRTAAFTARFPEAIDLLVRGLRSGLPVGETLQVIAREVPGPVGEEFRAIGERIRIGRTMEEAMQETADKLGTAEFQFFVITIAIQRETGGNLAETLANLSDVLRKRAQMKLKIKALSSESKASAYIVGSMPFIVFAMVWFVNPEYLAGFFSEDRLIIAGIGGLIWMSIGAFIMAKMVSFEI